MEVRTQNEPNPRSADWHPMAMVPWLRRWPPSLPRDLFYTLLWNTLIALGLTAALYFFGDPTDTLLDVVWGNFVVANLIGYLIHAGSMAGNLLTGYWPTRTAPWVFRIYYFFMVLLCIAIGSILGNALLMGKNPLFYFQGPTILHQTLGFGLLIWFLLYLVMLNNQHRNRAEALIAQAAQRNAEQATLLLKAQLQALQAQIEPHFLYNTLANVMGLIHCQPELAGRMLEHLIRFLRANLAASRAEHSTLGSETDLIADYLALMALRMGPRLSWHIDLPDPLRSLALPPMLLQPLVENAISHGLEPKVEGGSLELDFAHDGRTLQIQIRDTGVGIATHTTPRTNKPDGGIGLSNLRERLQQMYGQTASLTLSENTPCGLCATLRLPLKLSDSPASTPPTKEGD